MKKFFFPVLFFIAASAIQAVPYPVLLTIDISNPASVTFTATGNFSVIDTGDAYTITNFGVTLEGFLTSAVGGSNNTALGDVVATSSTLQPGTLNSAFNALYWDAVSSAGYVDLNLFRNTGTAGVENFTTGASAFTGTATFDLTSVLSKLPSAGTTGNIIAGWSGSEQSGVLGTWQVIPEPATYAAILGGLALVGGALRRRR